MKTGGRVEIQAFAGGQIGGSRDMIEAVANGSQQLVTRAPPTSARGFRPSRWLRRPHLARPAALGSRR